MGRASTPAWEDAIAAGEPRPAGWITCPMCGFDFAPLYFVDGQCFECRLLARKLKRKRRPSPPRVPDKHEPQFAEMLAEARRLDLWESQFVDRRAVARARAAKRRVLISPRR